MGNPKEALARVCNALGVEYETLLLQPVPDSPVVPDWEKDWKSNALAGVDETNIERWRSECSPEDLAFFDAVMVDELKQWGYETPPAPALPRSTRAMIRLRITPFKGGVYRFFRGLSDRMRVFLCRINVKAY